MKKLLLLLTLGLLTACSPTALMEKISDPEKTKIARDYLQRLMDGDVTLIDELEPSLRTRDKVEMLKAMRSRIPTGAPVSTDLVGYTSFHSPSKAEYNVTFQFGYSDRWVLANAAWREIDNQPRQIIGMSVVPLERSLQETNAFSFKRAGALHYVFITGLIIIPAFSIFTLITCIRTKFPRRKWMWVIFVMIGFFSFSINWTTGQIGVSFLAIHFFGASAMASGPYAPWIISLAFPIGAIAFWFKRSSLRQTPPLIAQTTPQSPDGTTS